jgi:hypothetical protein
VVDHQRHAHDHAGASDSASVSLHPAYLGLSAVAVTAASVTAEATVSDSLDLAAPPSVDDLSIDVTALDGKQRLFTLCDGTGTPIDQGVGDELMDAFVAFTIRLEDGPDPDLPNN